MVDYKLKYLKYKLKFKNLKQKGGINCNKYEKEDCKKNYKDCVYKEVETGRFTLKSCVSKQKANFIDRWYYKIQDNKKFIDRNNNIIKSNDKKIEEIQKLIQDNDLKIKNIIDSKNKTIKDISAKNDELRVEVIKLDLEKKNNKIIELKKKIEENDLEIKKIKDFYNKKEENYNSKTDELRELAIKLDLQKSKIILENEDYQKYNIELQRRILYV